MGQGIVIIGLNSLVEYNEVVNADIPGIWCYDTNSIIKHNRILHCYRSIWLQFYQPVIDSNFIYIDIYGGKGINADLGSEPVIRGNIVVINNAGNTTYGYKSGFNNGATLYNNEFYSL